MQLRVDGDDDADQVVAAIVAREVQQAVDAVFSGDFADGVIAFEGELLGGQEFVTFDQAAAKLLKNQKRKVRLLKTA